MQLLGLHMDKTTDKEKRKQEQQTALAKGGGQTTITAQQLAS